MRSNAFFYIKKINQQINKTVRTDSRHNLWKTQIVLLTQKHSLPAVGGLEIIVL